MDTTWNGLDLPVLQYVQMAPTQIRLLTNVYCVIIHVILVQDLVQTNAQYVVLDISEVVPYVLQIVH